MLCVANDHIPLNINFQPNFFHIANMMKIVPDEPKNFELRIPFNIAIKFFFESVGSRVKVVKKCVERIRIPTLSLREVQ
ncbi:hypothetical protein HAALTHF_49460n [Vreelandella aquamarina]|jgi:hypothetical protein|nr:hypothetical protein HAALTHF_49460n [Halomonas axialensis]